MCGCGVDATGHLVRGVVAAALDIAVIVVSAVHQRSAGTTALYLRHAYATYPDKSKKNWSCTVKSKSREKLERSASMFTKIATVASIDNQLTVHLSTNMLLNVEYQPS